MPPAAAPKPQTEMSQKDEPALFKARHNLPAVNQISVIGVKSAQHSE